MQNSQNVPRWIESSGGPFVVLPSSRSSAWSGIDGPDYEAACGVDEYLGVVRLGGDPAVEVLIVADEPLVSTYLDELSAVLQWQYAPSKEVLVSTARQSVEGLEWIAGPTIDVSGEMVMFDAVVPGNSLQADEMLLISLSPGRYQVETANFFIDDEICGRVHRFRASEG